MLYSHLQFTHSHRHISNGPSRERCQAGAGRGPQRERFHPAEPAAAAGLREMRATRQLSEVQRFYPSAHRGRSGDFLAGPQHVNALAYRWVQIQPYIHLTMDSLVFKAESLACSVHPSGLESGSKAWNGRQGESTLLRGRGGSSRQGAQSPHNEALGVLFSFFARGCAYLGWDLFDWRF